MPAKAITTDDLAAFEKRLLDPLGGCIATSTRATKRHFEIVAEKLLIRFAGAFAAKLSRVDARSL